MRTVALRHLLWAVLASCSSDPNLTDGGIDAALLDAEAPDAPPADAAPLRDAGSPDAMVSGADAGEVACATNPVELHTSALERYFVEISFEGRPAALQLDTGSSTTFLFQDATEPPFTPNLGTFTLGCETLPIAGRNLRLLIPDINGREVIGLLGMDYLLQKPTRLDIEGGRLERYTERPAALIASAHASFLFDDVQSHALVPLSIDGTSVRLLFDTGGGDTIWIGQNGRPGDREDRVSDAQGTIFSIYTGTGTITFPGAPPRVVTVARAPRFPYFEDTVRALGGNLHGLLGVSAFPGEMIVVVDRTFYLIAR